MAVTAGWACCGALATPRQAARDRRPDRGQRHRRQPGQPPGPAVVAGAPRRSELFVTSGSDGALRHGGCWTMQGAAQGVLACTIDVNIRVCLCVWCAGGEQDSGWHFPLCVRKEETCERHPRAAGHDSGCGHAGCHGTTACAARTAFPRRPSHTSLRLPHGLFSSLSCARASAQGNKGAAAIRFRFYDSTLCFVCSHLAAHQNNVAGRNADFANIVSKIEFRNAGVADRCALPTTIRSRSSVLPVSALRRGMN